MDLITGYGSGSESGDELDSPKQPSVTTAPIIAAASGGDAASAVADTLAAAAAAKPRLGLFTSLPVPKSVAPAPISKVDAPSRAPAASLPRGFFDNPADAAAAGNSQLLPGVPSDFFAAEQAAEVVEAADADVGPAVRPPPAATADLPQPSDTKLWSKLPAPKNAASKRKVMLRPQINLELLAASDSDDEGAAPAAKKAKPAAAAGGKPSILSFLPAPQHTAAGPTGTRLVAGSQQQGAGQAGTLQQQQQQQRRQQQQDEDDDHEAAPGPAGMSNEAYRLVHPAAAAAAAAADDGDNATGQASSSYNYQQYAQQHEQHYNGAAAAAAGAFGYSSYGYDASAAAAGPAAAAGGNSDYLPPEEALLQEALQAEAVKAARRGAGAGSVQLVMPEIQFKEVNADRIKYVDPSQREAAQGTRAALGTEYAAKLRAEAAPHVGSRLARSKHQIGTLFANAKLRELEVLENRAAGMKSKAETAGKYGWR